jgi:hypothetical protein
VFVFGATLRTWSVRAADNDIGCVEDLLFDDRTWRVVAVAIHRRSIVRNDRALVARSWFGVSDPARGRFRLTCSRSDVRSGILADPVTIPYFIQTPASGVRGIFAWLVSRVRQHRESTPEGTRAGYMRDNHLRWTEDIMGFCYQSTGGEIGIVEDILVDPDSMNLRSLFVERWNRSPGKHTTIAVRNIEGIDDQQKKIWVVPGDSGDRDVGCARPLGSDGLRDKGLRDATDGLLWSECSDPWRAAVRTVASRAPSPTGVRPRGERR